MKSARRWWNSWILRIAVLVLLIGLAGEWWYLNSLDQQASTARVEATQASVRPPTRPSIQLWDDQPPMPRVAAPVAPSGMPVEQVLLKLNDADAAIRQASILQINNLGGDALPMVEKFLSLKESLSPESLTRVEQAARVLRARARREAAGRQMAFWQLQQIRNAYQNSREVKPKYDADVKRAIDGWTYHFMAIPMERPPTREEMLAAFKTAEDKGCEDPLVLTLHYLAVGDAYKRGAGPIGKRFATVMVDFQSSEHPPAIKLILGARYIAIEGDEGPSEIYRSLKAHFKTWANDPRTPSWAMDHVAHDLFNVTAERNQDHFSIARDIEAAYLAAAPLSPGLLVLQGRRLVIQAWEARGKGAAGTVKPEQWVRFFETLKQAETVLGRAYEMDPTDPRAATQMISVKLGQGSEGGGRDVMEMWFARAMEADPDNVEACNKKIYYLEPKWHGSDEQIIAFGRECLQTGNWRGGIAGFLVSAHSTVASRLLDPKEYNQQPEVWEDLSAVYEGLLINFPNEDRQRSQYALLACQSAHWDVAVRQFAALGNRVDLQIFGAQSTVDYYKKKAARLAAESKKI